MIQSNAFQYINILDKAADASWVRNEVIAHNIANATTPGYKRQDVSFEENLKRELTNRRGRSVDHRVEDVNLNRLQASVYTDHAGYSYRLDGNNVDMDTENVALAENQVKYNGLVDSITREFQNLQAAMK